MRVTLISSISYNKKIKKSIADVVNIKNVMRITLLPRQIID